MFYFRILIASVVCYMASCSPHNNGQATKNVNYDSLREPLINANKMYVKKESDEIDQYAKFKGWKMITTGTGIRYMINKHGEGALAKTGQIAKINYKVSLLDGKLCYSSDQSGPKQFKIGEDHVEAGLHEVITYMHVGDKATVILPSHLAFGFSGDGSKIPAHSSVLYDIELLSLH